MSIIASKFFLYNVTIPLSLSNFNSSLLINFYVQN